MNPPIDIISLKFSFFTMLPLLAEFHYLLSLSTLYIHHIPKVHPNIPSLNTLMYNTDPRKISYEPSNHMIFSMSFLFWMF